MLEQKFGRFGKRISDLARGIDDSEVVPDRPTKSISAEVWAASRKESRTARTVVLKLKTREFKILTRSHTSPSPPTSCEQLTDIALTLRQNVHLGSKQLFRLGGVGLSNFEESANEPAQPELFK